MIRELKIMVAAVMAVAAFGVLGVAGAQGAQFHCTPTGTQKGCILDAENDGTGKTAHHVFEITNKFAESTTITCSTITGSATLTKVAETITTTAVAYSGCTWNGSPAKVAMNGCQYKLNANGGKNITIVACSKEIEFIIPTCTAKIDEQAGEGITYNNIGAFPNGTITLSANVLLNVTSLDGTGCGIKSGAANGPYLGHYTTGNSIIQATEDPGTKQVDAWWE